MIKVYLPIHNANIDLYFHTEAAFKDIKKLNKKELERILMLSFEKEKLQYEIVWEDRKDGLYFIVETKTEKKWIALSADYTRIKEDSGSTNAYFVQFIPMTIVNYFFDQSKKKKSIELYLKGIEHPRAKTKAQQVYYRLAKTIGIKILNEFELNETIQKNIKKPFQNISEWKLARMRSSSSNRSNQPSYLVENEDDYIFYGKTFGANGRESIFLLYVLAHLAQKEHKKIYLYEVNDNGTNAIESSLEESKKFKSMLLKLNIIYYADSVEYIKSEETGELDDSNKNARHQAEFIKNLLLKFNVKRDLEGNIVRDKKKNPIIIDDIKRCYLCGCDIQKLIIASHIHRITDINHSRCPFDKKRAMAVDGDNGLWLCANHDKLFEYGFIYFQGNKLVISEELLEDQKQYVEFLTYQVRNKIDLWNQLIDRDEQLLTIQDCHYNPQMHHYLEIHKKRTQKLLQKQKKKKKVRK